MYSPDRVAALRIPAIRYAWLGLAMSLGCALNTKGELSPYGSDGGFVPDVHLADAKPEGCVPKTCTSQQMYCGSISDGCGSTL